MQKRGAPEPDRGAGSEDDVFNDLIDVNRKAFEIKRFSAAYHALAAALHWADDSRNEKQLAQVQKLAQAQLKWIDLHDPGYEHSSESAKLRGHVSIFQNLERQAGTTLLRIRSRRQFENLLRNYRDIRTEELE